MQCLFHSEVFRDALQMCETTPSIETMVTIINEVAASEEEDGVYARARKHTRRGRRAGGPHTPSKGKLGACIRARALSAIFRTHVYSQQDFMIA